MGSCIAVIPVHNEAATIAAVVRAASVYVPVIVVDDASQDGGGALAAAAGAQVLRLSRQRGKGEALRCGFAAALQRGAEAVVTLDGDGQHDPHDIPRLLAAAQRWPEQVIIGSRMGLAAAIPRLRCYAIQTVSWWMTRLGGCTIRDTQSGLRLYPAALLRTLHLRHGRFLFESALLLKAMQAGWRVHEIPICPLYPPEHTSHYDPVRDGLAITAYMLYQSLRLWTSHLWRLCQTWRPGKAGLTGGGGKGAPCGTLPETERLAEQALCRRTGAVS